MKYFFLLISLRDINPQKISFLLVMLVFQYRGPLFILNCWYFGIEHIRLSLNIPWGLDSLWNYLNAEYFNVSKLERNVIQRIKMSSEFMLNQNLQLTRLMLRIDPRSNNIHPKMCMKIMDVNERIPFFYLIESIAHISIYD